MKRYIIMILAAVALFPLAAKEQGEISATKKAELFNARIQMMQHKLQLDRDQLVKFVPVYEEYVKTIESMLPPRPAMGKESPAKRDENLDMTTAYKLATDRINVQRRILDAQLQALDKLKKFLTPQQLLDFTKVENEMGRRATDVRVKVGSKHNGEFGKHLKEMSNAKKGAEKIGKGK